MATKKAVTKKKPRRRTTAEQKEKERIYRREYRARKRIKKNPTQKVADSDDELDNGLQAGAVGQDSSPESASTPQPEQEPASEEAKEQKFTADQARALLPKALAGAFQSLADSVQLIALDWKKPHLGHERAQTLSDLWAPILAPYISEHAALLVGIALVSGASAQVLYAWGHEYKEAIEAEEKESRRKKVFDSPTPLSCIPPKKENEASA